MINDIIKPGFLKDKSHFKIQFSPVFVSGIWVHAEYPGEFKSGTQFVRIIWWQYNN